MSTPHKASAEQWARQEEFAAGSDMLRCLLELRARIEALEAGAICRHIVSSDEGTSYCALAEQVAAKQESVPVFGAYNKTNDQEVIHTLEQKDEKYHLSAVPAPAGSLVERVAGAMGPSSQAAMDAGELPYGSACAAIREVAAWLKEEGIEAWAADRLLEQIDHG